MRSKKQRLVVNLLKLTSLELPSVNKTVHGGWTWSTSEVWAADVSGLAAF